MRSQRHAPAAFYRGKYPASIVQEAEWATGPAWTGAENLVATGIRSPYRRARSQSLYRLSYRAHCRSGTDVKSIAAAVSVDSIIGYHFQLRDISSDNLQV